MSAHTIVRRSVFSGVAALGAVAIAAGPALAHHCFIPMYSLNAPASSNWFVYTAESGAEEIVGFIAECDAQVDAGYAALKAEGLPVGIKIKVSMTIGDPKHTGRMNPNGANGKGLEYFEAGSTLPDEMLGVWISAAAAQEC